MPIMKNYTGKKYSHLTFTHRAPSRVGAQGALWYTICDCGNTREVEARQVVAGRVHTCGKCELGRDLTSRGRQEFGRRRSLDKKEWIRVNEDASKKGLLFSLSPNRFIELIHINCVYCNRAVETEPHTLMEIVSGVGYTDNNSMTVCRDCASLRGKRKHQDFLDLCEHITNIHIANRIAIQAERNKWK